MTTKKSGYKITVGGQYYVASGDKGKALKSYEFEINLPSMDRALSVIKGHVLDRVLSSMYPDYVRYRTHIILDVVPFGNVTQAKAHIWQMNRPTVISYIRENELPVNTEIYKTLMSLREAVTSAEADVDNFLRIQAKKEKEFATVKDIMDLNPEMYSDPEEDASASPSDLKPAKEEEDALADFMS